jgi:hypothetical protein
MTADHDVAYAEYFYRKLDGRGGRISARDVRAGDDVADVFHHKEIAGLALGDQLRQDARVRAGDEQRMRILFLPRETVKELAVPSEFVLLEFVNACDELLHGQVVIC